eukprot:CAMPEP_0195598978 /NCGR_PEP_ID=MMETSP0815-20121206/3793_1 /TAXON_ID=97485 /ORGANISM="Prymnesium parvum, Strain Texoma1" /LENGTH=72 /DNA_ID=CAMNT_0040738395 /DNA_START=104 /DNA_END=322 /DNA_ORIENTATION=-
MREDHQRLDASGEVDRMRAAVERRELREEHLARRRAERDGAVHPGEKTREHAGIQRLVFGGPRCEHGEVDEE